MPSRPPVAGAPARPYVRDCATPGAHNSPYAPDTPYARTAPSDGDGAPHVPSDDRTPTGK
ncbi:hypothetical protein GCM10009654_44850 [Streptomyces hebeiensis]|uniref:Uncharacterized protein n=1 Tax=Streptomyces hebeiensis TaxID=229486 RepID=A0ABN1UYU7_9ACTN